MADTSCRIAISSALLMYVASCLARKLRNRKPSGSGPEGVQGEAGNLDRIPGRQDATTEVKFSLEDENDLVFLVGMLVDDPVGFDVNFEELKLLRSTGMEHSNCRCEFPFTELLAEGALGHDVAGHDQRGVLG